MPWSYGLPLHSDFGYSRLWSAQPDQSSSQSGWPLVSVAAGEQGWLMCLIAGFTEGWCSPRNVFVLLCDIRPAWLHPAAWLWNGWFCSDVLKIQLFLIWKWFLLVWILQRCVLLEITAARTCQSSGHFVPFSHLNLTSPWNPNLTWNTQIALHAWEMKDVLPGRLHY